MPQKTKNTPMMEQYLSIKAQYQDAFLFYRLGDFYEMFYEDAEKAAQILELTLTSRNRNADDPIPMCGIPHHAATGYIDTLIEQGYKVAICEQMEDPKEVKGMVKREVIQLITPGTMMDTKSLEAKENNYLTALYPLSQNQYGFAYVDLSTGELKSSILTDEDSIINECSSLQTKEIILAVEVSAQLEELLTKRLNLVISHQKETIDTTEFQFLTQNLTEPGQVQAVKLLLSYLNVTQKRSLDHLQQAESYEPSHYLKMDHFSKFNLELTQSIRSGKKTGTLLWLLDETKTAMGARLLKQWLDRPLIQEKVIKDRQDMTQCLVNSFFERADLQEHLKKVYDLERLVGRVAFGSVNGRDMIQLKCSLLQIPSIRELLTGINQGEWNQLLKNMDPVSEVVDVIELAIEEEPPLSITEGNLIKTGYDSQLDTYRDAMTNGKKWLAELEAKERQETGIKTLKIGFNRVFGYYIEVTKSNLKYLEEGKYERKQTLTNAERFITPELKVMEKTILEAEEKSVELEYQLFLKVREQVKQSISRLQTLAKAVASVDVLQSFATVSEKYQYKRPELTFNSRCLEIIEGRHPVVEKVLGSQEYIPNTVMMDPKVDLLLITGPNMSGKSTYMRQLALTVIMAQMGCFVPAESAKLPIFDQIFTRIGATDDLISGQSTFMVEMMEANQALQHATPNSLILFDELGRGTATYDGMALAQAIIEFIHKHVNAKTLFSTHYHELTVLDKTLPKLKNIHVGAVEKNGEVVFLHKMMDGPADKSYGIHVAKLAGLPKDLLKRAATILTKLEANQPKYPTVDSTQITNNELRSDETVNLAAKENLATVGEVNEEFAFSDNPAIIQKPFKNNDSQEEQLSLFPEMTVEETEILTELKKLDLVQMTPLEALNILYALQKKL